MLKKTATICYQDGHEDTVILTARAQCQAARQQGKTKLPYEQWLDSIIDVVINTPDDTEDAQLDPTN